MAIADTVSSDTATMTIAGISVASRAAMNVAETASTAQRDAVFPAATVVARVAVGAEDTAEVMVAGTVEATDIAKSTRYL